MDHRSIINLRLASFISFFRLRQNHSQKWIHWHFELLILIYF